MDQRESVERSAMNERIYDEALRRMHEILTVAVGKRYSGSVSLTLNLKDGQIMGGKVAQENHFRPA